MKYRDKRRGLYKGEINHEILLKELQKNGVYKCKMEGRTSPDWKLIDAIDIIIHIFHPEKRKFYDLEKMWSEPIAKDRLSI